MQDEFGNNNIVMYSTHDEGTVIAKRFIKILKTKIYKKWQLKIENLILVIQII